MSNKKSRVQELSRQLEAARKELRRAKASDVDWLRWRISDLEGALGVAQANESEQITERG
jgi:polyhydroxyalkanoate synthesis regulator phasin